MSILQTELAEQKKQQNSVCKNKDRLFSIVFNILLLLQELTFSREQKGLVS
jgi:hypothetical protein